MSVTEQDTADRMAKLLEVFHSLNSEVVAMVESELMALADKAGSAYFDQAAAFAEDLHALYLDSPVKRNIRDTIGEYYYFIEKASKQLAAAEKDEPDPTPDPASTDGGQSVALVPEGFYSAQQWCRVATAARIPLEIQYAVDAAQRRNNQTQSVLLPLYRLLHRLDSKRAYDFQIAICDRGNGSVDPDVARDLVLSWQEQPAPPAAVLRQTLIWSNDEQASRHWPGLIREADKLLRMEALKRWLEKDRPETQLFQHLKRLAPFNNDKRLKGWLKTCISKMGTCIDSFLHQSEADAAPAPVDEAEDGSDMVDDWRRVVMMRELSWLELHMPALLLQADLFLDNPNGAHKFALAVFGFTQDRKKSWRETLEEQCRNLVRRCLLTDARRGQKPAHTIERLCFGDEQLCLEIEKELDLVTKTFDSLDQRDVVVDRLGVIYSSYREAPLLNTEIGRRYRRLMRVLHVDNLRRVLSPEQFAEIESGPVMEMIRDMSVIASASRKYLASRRALEKSTEEIIAAEMDYVNYVRSLRARYLRTLLDVTG